MKKNWIFVILILIFIVGCSSVDNRGFYLSGEKIGCHKTTKTNYDLEGYDKSGYNKEGYNTAGFDKKGINKKTGTKYDENGFDVNRNNLYSFHSNYNKDLEVVHTFNILVTDTNGLPLKNINVEGNLNNEANFEEVYNKDFSIITDREGKAKVVGTMNFNQVYIFNGTLHESKIKINIYSIDYFNVNKEKFEIKQKYKPSDNKEESKEIKIVLIPKSTIIHQANISVVDIEGIPLDEVKVSGKINEIEIKEQTNKNGELILKNSNFEIVAMEKNNNTKFDLKYEKDGYYNDNDSFSINEKWSGKMIVLDRKRTLYKQDDYYKKEFLLQNEYKDLRNNIKKLLELIKEQTWIKDANLPYRSIGIYEFKGKKYIELNIESTVAYNSLKSNKYDIGKNIYAELGVKVLDYLIMIEDKNLSGVNLRVTGYTKDFGDKNAMPTPIKYDFIMNKETIRKYKDKDITSQKLLDESVILMDNERIELRLQLYLSSEKCTNFQLKSIPLF